MSAKPGGALLLAEFLHSVTDAPVLSPELENIKKIPQEEILHSNAELELFPYSSDPDEKNKVYRIKRFLGFTGAGTSGLAHVKGDDPDADIVILDDAGNGFRDHEEYWPEAIKQDGKKPIVIYKMSRPLSAGKERYFTQKMVIKLNQGCTLICLLLNGLQDRYPGEMQGLSSAFVAALAARIFSQYKKLHDAHNPNRMQSPVYPTLKNKACTYRFVHNAYPVSTTILSACHGEGFLPLSS